MTDDELEIMIQESRAAGPLSQEEFQAETLAIRAYARQAWHQGLESGPAGRLDLDTIKHDGRLARDQKEGDLDSVGGPIGGPAEASG